MRKSTAAWIALLVLVIGIIAGYYTGSRAVLSSPKWVEEDGGLLLIVTDFDGDEYVDVADKPAHHYDELAFIVSRK